MFGLGRHWMFLYVMMRVLRQTVVEVPLLGTSYLVMAMFWLQAFLKKSCWNGVSRAPLVAGSMLRIQCVRWCKQRKKRVVKVDGSGLLKRSPC